MDKLREASQGIIGGTLRYTEGRVIEEGLRNWDGREKIMKI